jgi:hypothetical protein
MRNDIDAREFQNTVKRIHELMIDRDYAAANGFDPMTASSDCVL